MNIFSKILLTNEPIIPRLTHYYYWFMRRKSSLVSDLFVIVVKSIDEYRQRHKNNQKANNKQHVANIKIVSVGPLATVHLPLFGLDRKIWNRNKLLRQAIRLVHVVCYFFVLVLQRVQLFVFLLKEPLGICDNTLTGRSFVVGTLKVRIQQSFCFIELIITA